VDLNINLTSGTSFVKLTDSYGSIAIFFNVSIKLQGDNMGPLIKQPGGVANLTFITFTLASNNVKVECSLILLTNDNTAEIIIRSCNASGIVHSTSSSQPVLIGENYTQNIRTRVYICVVFCDQFLISTLSVFFFFHFFFFLFFIFVLIFIFIFIFIFILIFLKGQKLWNANGDLSISMTGCVIENCSQIYSTQDNNKGGLITFTGNSASSTLFINNTAFRNITHNSKGGVAYVSGSANSISFV
jgi:ABC-type multidrug transport system fused ATPase/permease subunit